ncbi:hypothetical protein LUZ60_015662 [Juncus effusus]|nr:hypothetical protein LUZ60_015662 [Juncus effusus]
MLLLKEFRSAQFNNAHKVFVKMLSSKNESLPDIIDSAKQLCKMIISSPKYGLETELDQCGVPICQDSVERVLKKLENGGMLAYRFFCWAEKKHNFCHSVNAYHTMIGSLAKIRQYKLMWDLVSAMQRERVLNVETFCIIMRRYARFKKVEEAVYAFNVMDKYGVVQNRAAFNGLLGALCKAKNVRKAQEVFDEMSERFEPDAKTYSILLEGWGREPNLPKMREVYNNMINKGCEPDLVTYGIMVDALCKSGRTEEAVELVREMSFRRYEPTTFIYSVLIHTYGVEKKIENAVSTFLEMERNGIKPDVVAYNALVTAFCKVNKYENAFRVIQDMTEKSINPNSRTYNILLNGLITDKQAEEAYRVFRNMIKTTCQPDSDTYTIMIKMFCDTDRLDRALKMWKFMKLKQFVPSMHVYSVLINGLCGKGEVSQACALLEDMMEKGIRPMGSTFGRLRKLLLKEGREDVLEFLVEKMKDLIDPFYDDN